MEIGAEAATLAQVPGSSPYGVSQEYVRSKFESQAAIRAAKDRDFGDKQTLTDSSGQLLHRSRAAAKRKYGSDRSSFHEAQTDHIDPIAEVHRRHRANPFLTDQDISEVVNRGGNFQEISGHDNASKGASTELEVALDPRTGKPLDQRIKQAAKGIKTQVQTDFLLAQRSLNNFGLEFAQGASDALAASAIPLAIRGVQDLVKVANGEMSAKDAAYDMGELGKSIAAHGGGVRTAAFALSTVLKNSQNEVLKNFAKANQIGSVLVVGSIIVQATGKYLSGEVDAEEFFIEISRDGTSLVGGMLASQTVNALLGGTAAAGGIAGAAALAAPVLAAMIASAVCSEIYTQAEKHREEKKDNAEIRAIAVQATRSIQQQEEELERLLDEDHKQWAQNMVHIFSEIAAGLSQNSLQMTNLGLRHLMLAYNREIELYEDSGQAIDALMAMRNGQKCLLG